MGEGTHLTDVKKRWSPKWAWIFGGTAALVAVAAVSMQIFRAESGTAAEDPAGSSGRAKVNLPQRAMPYLARVNSEMVTWEQVAAECMARHGKEILDDIVNRTIITQACEAQGIVVSEEEVNQEIIRIAKRFGLDPAQWEQMLLAERKLTPVQYRRDIIWPMLALKKLAGEQVEITEQDMQGAFVRNYGPRVKALMIMLDNPRRANEVWQKVKADPENFDKYAQEYSIDPNSRALGGKVHPIPRNAGNPELERVAFSLQPGEISGIVEIGVNKYVILKSDGVTEPKVDSISDVRDALYEELLEQKIQQSVATTFEQIKANATVDNYLTSTSTGPGRSAPAGGIQQTGASNPSSNAVRPAAGVRR